MQNMLVNSDSILLRPGTKRKSFLRLYHGVLMFCTESFKLRTLEHKHHSTVARFLSSHLIIQYALATRMEQASCLTL
jgi:hypothetical protein